MDPLSALSLVGSVISVIEISKEAVNTCMDLVESGSTSQYRATEDATKDIESSIRDLRDPLQAASTSPLTRDNELLIEIANKCIDTAGELKTMLEKLKKDSRGGFRDALKKKFKVMTKRKEIEQRKRDLDRLEKALNTRILTRLDINAARSSRAYDQVLQKLNDLGIAIANSNVGRDPIERSARGEEFLDSLRFQNIFSRQEQIVNAHTKTLDWIFQDAQDLDAVNSSKWPSFVDWLRSNDSSQSLYWIHGKAGSGKSTLMSYLVGDGRTYDALQAWCGLEKDSALLMPSFFFWSSGSPLQKNVQGLLRSLLYHLLTNNEALLEDFAYTQFGTGSAQLHFETAWTERRLLEILDKVHESSISKNIYICYFIDGLDEYEGDKELLKDWIFNLSGCKNVKVCVSSRPEEAYRQALSQVPQLRLQDLTQDDIKTYVHDRLKSRLPNSSTGYDVAAESEPSLTKENLLNDIVQKALGVFLWVKLVVSDLLIGIQAGESLQELQTRVLETPDEMRELYRHMLKKIPERFKEDTARYFASMLAAIEWTNGSVVLNVMDSVTLAELAFTNEYIWGRIRELDERVATESAFHEHCKKLESHVLFRCAGLVEIRDRRYDEKDLKKDLKEHVRPLSFIHRSAFEFLHDEQQDLLRPVMPQAFMLLARAKIGYYLSFLASESNFSDQLVAADTAVISATWLMDEKLPSQGTHTDVLQGERSDVIDSLFALLEKFNGGLWRKEHCLQLWQTRYFKPPPDTESDDILGRLAFYSFRRVVTLIEEHSPAMPSYFDSIVDCVLSSPKCYLGWLELENQAQIACAAFERGASLDRSVVLQLNFDSIGVDDQLLCVQRVWSILIWRMAITNSNERFNSFLHFCLSRGVDLDAKCIIPLQLCVGYGYFIREIPVMSIIEAGLEGPCKAQVLSKLSAHSIAAYSRVEYFVDSDSTLYRLNSSQSGYLAKILLRLANGKNFVGLYAWTFDWSADRSSLEAANKHIDDTKRKATKLGSLRFDNIVIGDESTYKIVTAEE